jgi:hypothetical protein
VSAVGTNHIVRGRIQSWGVENELIPFAGRMREANGLTVEVRSALRGEISGLVRLWMLITDPGSGKWTDGALTAQDAYFLAVERGPVRVIGTAGYFWIEGDTVRNIAHYDQGIPLADFEAALSEALTATSTAECPAR